MSAISLTNQIYIGSAQRKSVYDLEIPEQFNGTIILFIHGYKGFKDWGAWNLLQQAFTNSGFGFCKFNLSHNGGTVENPIDFPDLEAFANNRYSYELFDVEQLIELLSKQFPDAKIVLMGHSRGGGIALLCSNKPQVKAIITLAAISSIKSRFSNTNLIEKWKSDGVRYEENSRTNQQMPLYFTYYTDFLENQEHLDIENQCKNATIPMLHFHGSNDEAVALEEGKEIAAWTTNELIILENSNHTFETTHPWKHQTLSPALQQIVKKSTDFLSKN